MGKLKVIVVSGYFNPLHKGHLELFSKSKSVWGSALGYCKQRFSKLKGSKKFMDENERLIIVSAIKHVDSKYDHMDLDKTQCETLAYLADKYSNEYELNFANGGLTIIQYPRFAFAKKKELVF